jgi:hypothetical protein
MRKLNKTKMTRKILSWIGKITSFPVIKPYGSARPGEGLNTDTLNEPRTEQLCSGGYNEAFIFERWASYNPRH